MPKVSVIAIDGSAGSGKSVLGQLLAQRLGYLYYDTGALYRAVTWLALQRGLNVADVVAVAALAERANIQLVPPTVADGRQYTVLADGEDVTWQIRRPEVDARVSVVAAQPAVREALLAAQRSAAAQGRVVMVGRDIGTVILPDADLKIYLEASVAVRARRRYEELRQRGVPVSYNQVYADIERRDQLDCQRATAPLRAAPDAAVINTDHLTLEEEVAAVEALIQRRDC